ncbi:MAG: leucine-rich repeat protein [Clostridia bacterium]|nr:leucine-rich repeat protein [Clostridia bacterium]
MKRFFLFLLFLVLLYPAYSSIQARSEASRTTVMIYMCGSNLESLDGAASDDIFEMLFSDYNKDEINVVLLTGGSSQWNGAAIDSSKTNIFEITRRNSLRLKWCDSLLNLGESDTLSFFLKYAEQNYPADRYGLILWDHGGGPLSGICWDELFSDHLTIDEVTDALDDSLFRDKPLDWVGFDACLMASAEVAWRMSPYANYMIASEEAEPSYGWDYSFLSGLECDSDGAETAERIIRLYIDSARTGDTLTLSCIDLSQIDELKSTLDSYFSYMEHTLSSETFSNHSILRKSAASFGNSVLRAVTDTVVGDYDLVDLKHLLKQHSDPNWMKEDVLSTLDKCIVHNASTTDEHYGLSVYFPMYNKKAYTQTWSLSYPKLGFSDGYSMYIQKFGSMLTQKPLVDWESVIDSYESTKDKDTNAVHLSLLLTSEQQANFASARLFALGSEEFGGYYRVYVSDSIPMDENGRIAAVYHCETLHATDASDGHIMTPALDFEIREDGSYAINAIAHNSMSDINEGLSIVLVCDRQGDRLSPKNVYVFDDQTQAYTKRLSFDLTEYRYLSFIRTYRMDSLSRTGGWPSFENWPVNTYIQKHYTVSALNAFDLAFVADPSDSFNIGLEITDTQNNSYCAGMIAGSSNQEAMLFKKSAKYPFAMYADALLMDENGLYLTISCRNTNSRTNAFGVNEHFFFSPMINGVPCLFEEGTVSKKETSPESIGVYTLNLKWPEGVHIGNAGSVSFRLMNCFGDSEKNGAGLKSLSEYVSVTWDPSIAEGKEAVSMSSGSFRVSSAETTWDPGELANYDVEAISAPIRQTQPDFLSLTAPEGLEDAPGWVIVADKSVNPDGSEAYSPIWVVPLDSITAPVTVPSGFLSLNAGDESLPVCMLSDTDGTTAALMSRIRFASAADPNTVIASEIQLDLRNGRVSHFELSDGTLNPSSVPPHVSISHDIESKICFPIGLTRALSIEAEEYAPLGSLSALFAPPQNPVIENPVLPLEFSLSPSYSEAAVVVYIGHSEDGSLSVLREIPLDEAVSVHISSPASDTPYYSLYIDHTGNRHLRYGDFLVVESESEMLITGYVGQEEAVVIPDLLNGKPVIGIDIRLENPSLRQITLPKTLDIQVVDYLAHGDYLYAYWSDSDLDARTVKELFPYAYLEKLSGLRTIIVPTDCPLDEIPLKNFFCGSIEDDDNRYFNGIHHADVSANYAKRAEESLRYCDGFYYTLDESGSATLMDFRYVETSHYDGLYGTMTVPSTLDGYPVVRIATGALANYKSNALVIEEGVEIIDPRAISVDFIYALSLPSSIREIHEDALYTTSLNEHWFQNLYVSSSNSAYLYSRLKDSGARFIINDPPADVPFEYILTEKGIILSGLSADESEDIDVLSIPSAIGKTPVYRIGESAFHNLKRVKTIVIEEGIQEIGAGAFEGSSALETVSLPSTLLIIEANAFSGSNLRSVHIPASVHTIDATAFSLSEIRAISFEALPENMYFTQQTDQFEEIVCPAKWHHEIPARFPGEHPYRIVYDSADVDFEDGYRFVILQDKAVLLSGPLDQERIALPAFINSYPVTHIAPDAFLGASMEQVSYPEHLKFISSGAFSECRRLKAVSVPDTVLEMGIAVFEGCSALTTAVLPAPLKAVPERTFSECTSLESVELPQSTQDIGDRSFYACSSLIQIDLPEGLKRIGESAFRYSGLIAIAFPDSLREIGNGSLPHTILFATKPPEEAAVHKYAFEFPEQILFLESGAAVRSAFDEHIRPTKEKRQMCGANVEWRVDEEGVLILSGHGATDDVGIQISQPWYDLRSQIKEIKVEEGVESLGSCLFEGLENLTGVSLPGSLISIGRNAFNGCVSLKTIEIPQSVHSISSSAFRLCTSLHTVVLPDGLETIESLLFADCISLKNITLPSGLKVIRINAFMNCKSLAQIIIPEGTKEIELYAFHDCTNLLLVDFPQSLESIGHNVFVDSDYMDKSDRDNEAFVFSPNYNYLKFRVVEGSYAHAYVLQHKLLFELKPLS